MGIIITKNAKELSFVYNSGVFVSIKDDLKYVEKELSSDEKMLESTLKLEAFYNKHKRMIWIGVVIVLSVLVVKPIFSMIQESKLNSANSALLALEKNPKDSQAIEILKSKNPPLYELYTYSQAVSSKDIKELERLSKSKNHLIADVSSYHKQVLASKGSQSHYYREMSLIEDAYLALKDGNGKKARSELDLIDTRSPVAPVAELLKHYTIKGQ